MPAPVSQFEQLVRAVCGLPLGSVEHHSDAVMTNLLGDEVLAWREILADPERQAASLRQAVSRAPAARWVMSRG